MNADHGTGRLSRLVRRLMLYRRALASVVLGVIAIIAALGFGTASLRPVGVALIVVGIGAIILVEATARGVRVDRSVTPEITHAGEPVTVTMTVRGASVTSRIIHLLDWRCVPGLTADARERRSRVVRHGRTLRQEMIITGLPRGDHALSLPGVALADPFGLVRVRRATRTQQSLVVLPRTVPIRTPFWESGGAPRTGDQAAAVRGRFELAGVRDYEPGDPLSIIHWGQTARRGRLQTKELHGGTGRTTRLILALDRRDGSDPRDFETAVQAAASLAEAGAARDIAVGYVDSAEPTDEIAPQPTVASVLRRLAGVVPRGDAGLGEALTAVTRDGDESRLVMLILTQPDPLLGAAITRLRMRGMTVAAVLVGRARAATGPLESQGVIVASVPDARALGTALNAGGRRASW